jgi:hypothetical protein
MARRNDKRTIPSRAREIDRLKQKLAILNDLERELRSRLVGARTAFSLLERANPRIFSDQSTGLLIH